MKEYVRDLLDNDSKLKFLLFAHHTSVLDGFSDLLDELVRLCIFFFLIFLFSS